MPGAARCLALAFAARVRGVSLLLMLAAGAVGAAHASGDLGAPPSPAQQCVTPSLADGARPEYPPAMLRIKRGARLRAEFTFAGPDQAPSVELGDTQDDFREAVRAYARKLRVPCMKAGDPPVVLRQEIDFVPNDGRKVALTLPEDESTGRAKSNCAARLTGAGIPAISYPPSLARSRLEGNVVARLHFADLAGAPEMTVLDDGGSALFVRAITPSIEAVRLVCVGKAPAEPVDLQVYYSFQIDGSADRVVLRDVTLKQFLGVVKPFPKGAIYFDTQLMKCPFDVRLTLRQPWGRNRIDELDEDVESRHTFLSWLSTLELKLPPRDANRVLGQSTIVHVPCAVLDL